MSSRGISPRFWILDSGFWIEFSGLRGVHSTSLALQTSIQNPQSKIQNTPLRLNLRPHQFPPHDPRDVPFLFQVEHHQRDLSLHAEGDGGQVHHAELLAVDLLVTDVVVK